MMVPITLCIESESGGLILEMEAVADVHIEPAHGSSVVEWAIESYYIDTSTQARLGVHKYELIEDESVINLLSVHEDHFNNQIGNAIHEHVWSAA